jgi:hypothetical protein
MTTDLRRKLLQLFVSTEGEIVFQQVLARLPIEAMLVDRPAFSQVLQDFVDEGVLLKRTIVEQRRVHNYYQMSPLQKLAAI